MSEEPAEPRGGKHSILLSTKLKNVRTCRYTFDGYCTKECTMTIKQPNGREQQVELGYKWSARHPEPRHKFPPYYGCEGPRTEKVRRVTCVDKRLGKGHAALRPTNSELFNAIPITPTSTEFRQQQAAGYGPSDGTNWLSEWEYKIFCEINLLRCSPYAYAQKIEDRLQHLRGRTFWIPDRDNRGITTHEGRSAFEEAVEYLRTRNPVAPLVDAPRGMSLACKDHCRDTGVKGIMGHCGSDDSHIDSRLSRYGRWAGKCSELIVYGLNSPEDVVISLVVDDGNLLRCHRSHLLDPQYKYCGICWEWHTDLETICTIAVASRFTDLPMVEQRAEHFRREAMYLPSAVVQECAVCSQKVNGLGLYAIGGIYHPRCFQCSVCRVMLKEYTTIGLNRPHIDIKDADGKVVARNSPFCPTCYEECCVVECVQCKKPIRRFTSTVNRKPLCFECLQTTIEEKL